MANLEKHRECIATIKDNVINYVCPTALQEAQNNLFWWTGVALWSLFGLIIVYASLWVVWESTGGFAFALKVYRHKSLKRAGIKDFVVFWSKHSFNQSASVSFPGTGLTLYRPWPWLSTTNREKAEYLNRGYVVED